MKKGHKIRRYGNIYSASGSNSPVIMVAMVAGLAIFSLLGWSLYPVVYDFVSNIDNPAANVSGSEPPLPTTSTSPQESAPPSEAPAVLPPTEPSQSAPEQALPDAMQKAVFAPLRVVNDTAAFDALLKTAKQSGITHILVEAKDVNGAVYFQTANAHAIKASAMVASSFDAKSVAKKITDAGLTPMVRLHAFRDNFVGRTNREMAVGYYDSTYVWLDNSESLGGRAWLNPYIESARQYVADLAAELATSGFKMILLDSANFPTGVGLDKAGYGDNTGDRNEVLRRFVKQVEEAAAQGNASVAVSVSESVVSGGGFEAKPQIAVGAVGAEIWENTQAIDAQLEFLQARFARSGILIAADKADGASATAEALEAAMAAAREKGAALCILYSPEGKYSLK